jgi:flagellar biosynthesis/type III secretory pathway protein FliH
LSPNAASPAAFDFEQLSAPPRQERPLSMGEATSKARALVAAAETEAQKIREHARREGYAEGLVAGRAELQALAEPVVQALSSAVDELRELRARSADDVEAEAVSLAMEIAEKVVAGTIAVEPERVLDVVRGALRAIVDRERLVILVNPDDLPLVREGMQELAGTLGGIEHVEVQEERRVQRGGAVVRTSVGEIDAKIATKLERAREAVEAALGQ